MSENNESFQKRKNIFQTLKIEALEREIDGLNAKLIDANNEIGRLEHIIQYQVAKTNNKAVLG